MISFCHPGGKHMASYRYRCLIPAKEMGASINDPNADVLIFTKPNQQDIPHLERAKARGGLVIADFCDPHFDLPHYGKILRSADAVTCPTQWFSDYLRDDFGVEATVVPDPYEFPEIPPHCNGTNLLWFGHAGNLDSLQRIRPSLEGYNLTMVSNVEGMVPWSLENLGTEFVKADIVVLPETAPYKSPNRTIESIRQGCFVVAEPHPSINDFPGIWLGNIKKGIEWAQSNPSEANQRTRAAQEYIAKSYSPQTQASAWRTAIQKARSSLTLAREISSGPVGSRWTPTLAAG